MLGHITDPSVAGGLDRRELPDPEPAPGEVLVEVRAFALNRGELTLLEQRPDGWPPGQDHAGVVARAAADGRELGVAAGAEVTALVSRPDRADAARGLGAHAVAVPDGDDLELVEGGDPGRFDAALDGVGGTVLRAVIRRLEPRATAVAYGVAGSREPTPLAFFDFAQGPLARLVGFFVYATGEATFGDDLGALAAMVADGRLTVDRGEERSWDDLQDALQALRDRTLTGKAVLTRRG